MTDQDTGATAADGATAAPEALAATGATADASATGATASGALAATGATGTEDATAATGATDASGASDAESATGATALPSDVANVATTAEQLATGLPQAVLDNNHAAEADLAAAIGATADAGATGGTAPDQVDEPSLTDRVYNLEDLVARLFQIVNQAPEEAPDQPDISEAVTASPVVRAKFRCTGVSDYPTAGQRQYRTVAFMAAVDGDENKAWSAATPAGSLSMTITNLDAADAFELGKSYYLDFTPAD